MEAVKIKVDRGYKMVICLENCKFDRKCANHDTAGDFRMEDGFTPKLSLRDGEVYCGTKNADTNPDWEPCIYPSGNILGLGFLRWTDLVEEVNDYNI